MAKINGNKSSANKLSLGSDNELLGGFIEENKDQEYGQDVIPVQPLQSKEQTLTSEKEEIIHEAKADKGKTHKIESSKKNSSTQAPKITNPDYISVLKDLKDNKDRDSEGFTSARISVTTHNEIDKILYILRHDYKFKGDIKLIMEAGIQELKKQLGIKF